MDPDSQVFVRRKELEDLCRVFKANAYSTAYETPEAADALDKCKALLELDYKVVELSNTGGSLCAHYPSRILICQSELPDKTSNDYPYKNDAINLETEADVNQLRNQILKARKGRARARFPIPVIFYQGKNICRSGTTAHFFEIMGRATVETLNSYVIGTSEASEDESEERGDEDQFNDDQNLNLESSVRKNDIQLLKMYNVESIFDLMVEQRKVKYGVYVTSSESADEENRYKDFKIFHVPYPGCEFFVNINHSGKQGIKQYFDWSQKMVDKIFDIPDLDKFSALGVNWDDYKTWDITSLTKNYLALIIKQLHESNTGILVHCISGWDRTPLFISLIRLCLWADGLIHRSLNVWQILYFTIAYDWMLFGHNLKNRVEKNEEIFFFCFYVLKHLTNFEITKENKLVTYPDGSATKVISFKDNGNDEPPLSRLPSSEKSDVLSDYGEYENLREEDLLGLCESQESESPSSPSIKESNGNNASPPSIPTNGSSSRAIPIPKRSSPMAIMRNMSNTSDPEMGASWAVVTETGSLTNKEDFLTKELLKKRRNRRLQGVRNEFYRIYFQCVPVSYSAGASVLGQVLGNLSERVGFS